MDEIILTKVREAIAKTGYPLELEVAAIARRNGWTPFHAVEYVDPETKKLRELDLLIYKEINERRIELRVSCKSSVSKQFVFFNIDRRWYIPFGDLKCTPVSDDFSRRRAIENALSGLPLFSQPMQAINYTVVAGNSYDREARALLRDALMSVVSSAHYRLLPRGLLFDQRGTVYIFLVVLRGPMFAATFDESTGATVVMPTSYALWNGSIPIPQHYWEMTIPDQDGNDISFRDAIYWFGSDIYVELIQDSEFERYLKIVETAFASLAPENVKLFGKPWNDDNFPSIVGPPPQLKTVKKEQAAPAKRRSPGGKVPESS